MRPVSSIPRLVSDAPRPGPAGQTAGRTAGTPAGDAPDVEVSVRLYADGTQISVVRRTVPAAHGRRTVGIDAVIR